MYKFISQTVRNAAWIDVGYTKWHIEYTPKRGTNFKVGHSYYAYSSRAPFGVVTITCVKVEKIVPGTLAPVHPWSAWFRVF